MALSLQTKLSNQQTSVISFKRGGKLRSRLSGGHCWMHDTMIGDGRFGSRCRGGNRSGRSRRERRRRPSSRDGARRYWTRGHVLGSVLRRGHRLKGWLLGWTSVKSSWSKYGRYKWAGGFFYNSILVWIRKNCLSSGIQHLLPLQCWTRSSNFGHAQFFFRT